MVSCGGNGWCRFWDASGGRLVGEFQAHLQASSIILDIEKDENYLVTADVNGNLRVWNIMDYCRNINQDNTLIKTSRTTTYSTLLSMFLFRKRFS